MPLLITKGFGAPIGGANTQLLSTQGYGGPGPNAACTPFNLLSSEVYTDRVELIFDQNISLIGAAALASGWTISTNTPNIPMTVQSIQVVGPRIKLFISEGSTGGIYTINLPLVGIRDTSNELYQGPFTYDFTAIGVPPFIAIAISLDAFHVQVNFSEPVVVSDALNVANYGVVPTLTIYSAVQNSPVSFTLETSAQTPGQSYTITANNIKDLQNNPI